MSELKFTGETGPIYDVKLIDSLPIGNGGWVQAMPSREDLKSANARHGRLVAGFEVLLHHYTKLLESNHPNDALEKPCE